MTALTEQENTRIGELAVRLRLVQADASKATSDKRREYLQEELAHYLKHVLPANRRRYLQALLTRFPVGGQIPTSQPAGGATTPPPEPKVETPDELLERLLAAMGGMADEHRAVLARKILESGLVPADRSDQTVELSEQQQRSLGLPAGQSPRVERLVQLTALLVDMFSQMDQQAVASMRELSPRSPLLNRAQDFRSAGARFLLGEDKSFEAQVRAMRSLFGALFLAILGGGKLFGREVVERLSPSAIEDVIAGEGKGGGIGGLIGIGPSSKEKCWEKYKDLASDYATADLMDRRLKDCLAAFVEKTVGVR